MQVHRTDYERSCMATWRRSFGSVTPGGSGRGAGGTAGCITKDPPEHAFREVNCRWLREHATTCTEQGFPLCHLSTQSTQSMTSLLDRVDLPPHSLIWRTATLYCDPRADLSPQKAKVARSNRVVSA